MKTELALLITEVKTNIPLGENLALQKFRLAKIPRGRIFTLLKLTIVAKYSLKALAIGVLTFEVSLLNNVCLILFSRSTFHVYFLLFLN